MGLGAIGATLQVSARLVAMHASEQALVDMFVGARALATGATLLDVFALAVVCVWLGVGRWWRTAGVALMIFALSALLSYGALRGSHYEAALWQVLVSRMFAGMMRHPMPLAAPWLLYGLQAVMLCAVLVVLVSRRRGQAVHAVVALTLVAGGATDIPVLAMALTLAALILPLASVSESANWVGTEHATKAHAPAPAETPGSA